MMHLGQVVIGFEDIGYGQPVIYGGFVFGRPTVLVLLRDKEGNVRADYALRAQLKPIYKEDGQIEIGDFCRKMGLVGHFFGEIEVTRLTKRQRKWASDTMLAAAGGEW